MTLYEILVPAEIESSRTCPGGKYNPKGWDEFVGNLAGGLTLVKKTQGLWVHSLTRETVKEAMVVVRVACSAETMDKIIDFTIEYYKQDAVMAYEVSNNVIIRHKK